MPNMITWMAHHGAIYGELSNPVSAAASFALEYDREIVTETGADGPGNLSSPQLFNEVNTFLQTSWLTGADDEQVFAQRFPLKCLVQGVKLLIAPEHY